MNDEIHVNQNYVKLRTVAFILAVAVAVGAFTFGVTRIAHKDPGYALVETNPDEEAPRYAGAASLRYYFSGSSDEIREAMNRLRDDYSAVLSRAYKLLDAENTYTGFENLATLNQSAGQPVQVSAELYAILQDAWELTQKEPAYTMFGGALSREWQNILVLAEPQPFDPSNDPDEATRIAKIAEMTANPEHFTLEFLDEAQHTVRFAVSEAYRAMLAEYELEAPVLELNQLHDAYLLRLVASVLEEQGWNNGYLATESGLTVSLSAHENGEFCFYGLKNGKTVQLGSVPVTGGTVCSQRKAFAFVPEEPCYYALEDGTLRHPNFDLRTGELRSCVASVYAISDDAVEAALQSLKRMTAATEAEAASMASGCAVYYTLTGEQPPMLHQN